ncbi:MAG: hypothetical protein KDI36_04090 [Pseudomonadales bacterium]|nr:hypothetical protein [Pseudomonadales bacterium]
MAERAPVTSIEDVYKRVAMTRPLKLDTSVLKKGIDNYHADVSLSEKFVAHAHLAIEEACKRIIAGKRIGPSEALEALRNDYEDVMGATLHRAKTDLKPEQICLLQFAVIKLVLQLSRDQIDGVLHQFEEKLAQQQYAGSRSLLVTQEQFAHMRAHRDEYLYKLNRAILRQLNREENTHLRAQREQWLQGQFREAPLVMFNPLLCSPNVQEPHLLVENYALWHKDVPTSRTLALEKKLSEAFPQFSMQPLKDPGAENQQNEVYDEFHGLFALQSVLGPAADQQDKLQESFGWLEQPGNIRLLFDKHLHEQNAEVIREEQGMRAQWSYNSDAKKLVKIFSDIRREMGNEEDLKIIMAGYALKEQWSGAEDMLLDLDQACRYVAGTDDKKKILAKIDTSVKGVTALLKKLDIIAADIDKKFSEDAAEVSLRALTDYCRYRLHLRYARLAHRIFNRIRLITEPEEIHLSRVGHHLYQLVGSAESEAINTDEPEIIHHAVLKADVRGSTTVTCELIKQGLNPATYFSLRFFEPITALLPIYGAKKVFIEGDAVILSTEEWNNAPDQWYAVSRCCGLARDMIDIVNSKNAHSEQTGLPKLEIGIGICYENDKPLFLFDEQRPIMISSAIGNADRMSSCSWKLRETFQSDRFNVEVLEISEKDRERGEKGQQHIRYNVNGVALDDSAFRKLMSEIALKKLDVRLADHHETFYVGKFPDMQGKERELVIRQGYMHLWEDERIVRREDEKQVFYEVLPHSRLASQVLEFYRKKEK